jgi:hypothetical protein
MTREPVVTNTGRRVTEAGARSRRLPFGQPGTILFAMYASVGQTAILGTTACWNQAILGLQPISDRACARFIRYGLDHLRPELARHLRSNTQDNLNAEQVANLPFTDLILDAKRRIAGFLDAETARIDALVEKKWRLIDLLEERRGSVMADGIRGRFTGGTACSAHLMWTDVRPVHWGDRPVDPRGGRQCRRRRRPADESLRRRGVGGGEVPPRRLRTTTVPP